MLVPILLIATLVIPGCTLPTGQLPPNVHRWVTAQGGLANEATADRVSRVCDPFLRLVEGRPVRVFVLESDTVAAYAWTRSSVYVRRGLADLATDDELAAAIAHELGHLVIDGHLSSPLALTGSSDDDAELRADRWGCCLLEQCGVPPTAMRTLLEKVKVAHATNDSCRAGLDVRIRSLVIVHP